MIYLPAGPNSQEHTLEYTSGKLLNIQKDLIL
jgi:hypothetical protein